MRKHDRRDEGSFSFRRLGPCLSTVQGSVKLGGSEVSRRLGPEDSGHYQASKLRWLSCRWLSNHDMGSDRPACSGQIARERRLAQLRKHQMRINSSIITLYPYSLHDSQSCVPDDAGTLMGLR